MSAEIPHPMDLNRVRDLNMGPPWPDQGLASVNLIRWSRGLYRQWVSRPPRRAVVCTGPLRRPRKARRRTPASRSSTR